jgi:hypothetical protein
MSLEGFQRALADLVAAPALCLAVREDPDDVLSGYDLSGIERRRLWEVVWQRGMSANCTVHRATRVTPIYTLLPLTCAALGPALGAELDAFWSAAPRMLIRFDLEISRFARFLQRRLERDCVDIPHDRQAVTSLLAIELACETIRLAPTGSRRRKALQLQFEPVALLGAARLEPPDFSGVPKGDYRLIVSRIRGEIKVSA